MATLAEIHQAIIKAGDAGDGDAVRALGAYLKTMPAEGPDEFDRKLMNPTDGMSTVDKAVAGFGHSLHSTYLGAKQLLGLASQDEVNDDKRLSQPLMNTTAGKVGDIGGDVAQMVVPGGAAARGIKLATKAIPAVAAAAEALPTVAKVVNKLTPYVGAAATGGAFNALQPVQEGETRTGNAAAGAAAGAAGQGVGSLVGAALKGGADALTPAVKALYDKAQAAGIPVNIAQLSDSKFLKGLQSLLERTPFTGAQAAKQEQAGALTQAISKTFGEDTPSVTPDVYTAAKKRIGGTFEDLTSRNNLTATDKVLGALGDIESEATKMGNADSANAVKNFVSDFLSKADENGVIPGKAYQSLDSQLGKYMKGGDEKAMYLGRVRDAIRSGMDDSMEAAGNEADKAAWQTARSQYRNLKTVRDLVAKSPDGTIPASGLMARVTADNAGKEAMAQGTRGELGDLARIAQQFVRDPVESRAANPLGPVLTNALLGGITGGAYGYHQGEDPTNMLTHALYGAGAGMAGGATLGRGANMLLHSNAAGRYMTDGTMRLLQQLPPQAQAAVLASLQRGANALPALTTSVVDAKKK